LSDDVVVKFGADIGGFAARVDEVKQKLEGLRAPFDALKDGAGGLIKAGTAATTFKDLSIALSEVQEKSKDLPFLLQLIGDRATASSHPLQRMAELPELISRGIDSLIPLLREGAAGWGELRQKSQSFADGLDRNAVGIAQTAAYVSRLTLDLRTLGIDGFAALRPLIDFCAYAFDGFVARLNETARDTEANIQNLLRLGEALNKPPNRPVPMTNRDLNGSATPAAKPNYGRDSSETREDAAIEKDLEREIAEEARLRIAALDGEKRAADINFNSQIAHLQALISEGKLSASEALKQEQLLNVQKWSTDENYLQQKLDLYEDDAAGLQRVQDDELAGTAEFNAKMQEITDRAAIETQQSWKQSIQQLSDSFAGFATDVLLRTETIAKAFDRMVRSLLDDFLKANFKSLADELLFGGSSTAGGTGSGGLFGGLGGDLVKSLFGDAFKGVLGNPFASSGGGMLGGLLPLGGGAAGGWLASLVGGGAGGGASAEAADVASMWGGGGADAVQAGMNLEGGGALPGIFNALLNPFKWFGGLLGFGHGGIVPSAAGGWVVPAFADGGILSVLHQNEMVLPAPISRGLQNMIATGGMAGGHTINIYAIDGASVARLFRNNGSALVAALNSAMRHGSMLTQSQ
jgi:hypothetical protein